MRFYRRLVLLAPLGGVSMATSARAASPMKSGLRMPHPAALRAVIRREKHGQRVTML